MVKKIFECHNIQRKKLAVAGCSGTFRNPGFRLKQNIKFGRVVIEKMKMWDEVKKKVMKADRRVRRYFCGNR